MNRNDLSILQFKTQEYDWILVSSTIMYEEIIGQFESTDIELHYLLTIVRTELKKNQMLVK